MSRQRYPTEVTDAEWSSLAPHVPAPKAGGRPRLHAVRQLLTAMVYVRRSGCAWRLLPHTLPPWKTVSQDFRLWRLQGLWDTLHKALHAAVRIKAGRDPPPTAAIIDSPSVKTSVVGGPRGYDGGKKVNGRKRHLLVDTPGLILRARVHPADIADRDGARLVLASIQELWPRGHHVWADMGYRGEVIAWIKTQLGWTVEVVKRPSKWGRYTIDVDPPPMPAFTVLPRRWVVEMIQS